MDSSEPEDDLSCAICSKQFKSTSGLRYHVSSHGSYELKCDICQKEFHNKQGLKQHEKIHDSSKNLCPTCGKSFSKPYWLKRHEEVKHQTTSTCRFECEVCGRRCTSAATLKAHRCKHVAKPLFDCHKCGKTFLYKFSLNRHQKGECSSASCKSTATVECEICKKQFKQKRYLKQHKRAHEEPKLACHICGKKFTWKSCLKTHLKSCEK